MQDFREICVKNTCLENDVENVLIQPFFTTMHTCIPAYPRGIGCCGWDSRNENIFCTTKLFYFFHSLTFIIQTFSWKVCKVCIVCIIVRNVEIYRLISRFSTSPPSDLCTRYASGMHDPDPRPFRPAPRNTDLDPSTSSHHVGIPWTNRSGFVTPESNRHRLHLALPCAR